MIANLKDNLTRFLKARRHSHSDKYPRKPLDAILEYLRFTKAESYIPEGAELLDIGAGDGDFLRYLNGNIHSAVGIDCHLTRNVTWQNCRLISGYFPHDFSSERTFDVITMMAVAEHIPMEVFPYVAEACWKYLNPGGQIIITVPHPRMDGVLNLLQTLRFVEGFSMHEHYGFDPECLPDIFNRWKLIKRERWGLGCNNLFIFEKPF